MRFALIETHQPCWPVTLMCRVLAVTRGGYYHWLARPESRQAQRRRRVTKLIQIAHAESRKTYGSPRVHRDLLKLGQTCRVNFVAKLMRSAGIVAKTRRKFKVTTDSKHNLPVADNLLARDFSPEKTNQAWTTDITFIPTREGWLYLATVEDLFSRRIVGWAMSSRIDSRLVVDALQMAIDRRRPMTGVMVPIAAPAATKCHVEIFVKFLTMFDVSSIAIAAVSIAASITSVCWRNTDCVAA